MLDTSVSSKLLLIFAFFSVLFILYTIFLYSYFNYNTIYINIGFIASVLCLLYYIATFNGLPTRICNTLDKKWILCTNIVLIFAGLVGIYDSILFVMCTVITDMDYAVITGIVFLIISSIFISYGLLINIKYVNIATTDDNDDINKKENIEMVSVCMLLLVIPYIFQHFLYIFKW